MGKIRSIWHSCSSVVNGYNDSIDISNEFVNMYDILYESVSYPTE